MLDGECVLAGHPCRRMQQLTVDASMRARQIRPHQTPALSARGRHAHRLQIRIVPADELVLLVSVAPRVQAPIAPRDNRNPVAVSKQTKCFDSLKILDWVLNP